MHSFPYKVISYPLLNGITYDLIKQTYIISENINYCINLSYESRIIKDHERIHEFILKIRQSIHSLRCFVYRRLDNICKKYFTDNGYCYIEDGYKRTILFRIHSPIAKELFMIVIMCDRLFSIIYFLNKTGAISISKKKRIVREIYTKFAEIRKMTSRLKYDYVKGMDNLS